MTALAKRREWFDFVGESLDEFIYYRPQYFDEFMGWYVRPEFTDCFLEPYELFIPDPWKNKDKSENIKNKTFDDVSKGES